MASMMARPWKHPKTGFYWYRRRVPGDLVQAFGKAEEKFSLRTKDVSEAKLRHAEALAVSERRWQSLRQKSRPLSEEEILAVAHAVHERCLKLPALLNGWRLDFGDALFAKVDLPSSSGASSYALAGADEYFARLPMEETCRSFALQAKQQHGIVTDEQSDRRLLLAIASAVQAAAKKTNRRSFEDAPWALNSPSSIAPAASNPVLLEAILKGWAAEMKPVEKTLYMWGRVVEQLAVFLGHRDGARVATSDIVRWKASLLESGLSARTVRFSKLAPIAALFGWASKNSILPSNAAAGVDVRVKMKPGEGRRGYSDEEAKLILRAARREQGALRWLPWLCAYTGARLSELCQLRRSDVVQIGEVWCINLIAEAGSLKNVGSERTIPLHPCLVDEGFLTFARRGPSSNVFPDLTPDRFGSRGGNGTKIVSRWIRGLGVTDRRLAPAHSWRHRLKTLARRHGLAGDAVDAITGHARKSVGDQYGEFEVEALLRELSKLPPIE